jgi:hypothetical protein
MRSLDYSGASAGGQGRSTSSPSVPSRAVPSLSRAPKAGVAPSPRRRTPNTHGGVHQTVLALMRVARALCGRARRRSASVRPTRAPRERVCALTSSRARRDPGLRARRRVAIREVVPSTNKIIDLAGHPFPPSRWRDDHARLRPPTNRRARPSSSRALGCPPAPRRALVHSFAVPQPDLS